MKAAKSSFLPNVTYSVRDNFTVIKKDQIELIYCETKTIRKKQTVNTADQQTSMETVAISANY